MYVIVEAVTSATQAADALAARGEHDRARLVRTRGEGRFLVCGDGPFFHRDDAVKAATIRNQGAVPGLGYRLSVDYDPDWSRQHAAAREALGVTVTGGQAVAAVNAFNRSYYHFGPGWDIDPNTDWRNITDAIRFRDGAYLLTHAVTALGCADPGRLAEHAHRGWADQPAPQRAVPVERLVWALAHTLAATSQGTVDVLIAQISHAAAGDS